MLRLLWVVENILDVAMLLGIFRSHVKNLSWHTGRTAGKATEVDTTASTTIYRRAERVNYNKSQASQDMSGPLHANE